MISDISDIVIIAFNNFFQKKESLSVSTTARIIWFQLHGKCLQMKSNAFVCNAACDVLAEQKPFDNMGTFGAQFFRAAQANVSIGFYKYTWNNEVHRLCYELAERN